MIVFERFTLDRPIKWHLCAGVHDKLLSMEGRFDITSFDGRNNYKELS
jgi:hypothetical protein